MVDLLAGRGIRFDHHRQELLLTQLPPSPASEIDLPDHLAFGNRPQPHTAGSPVAGDQNLGTEPGSIDLSLRAGLVTWKPNGASLPA